LEGDFHFSLNFLILTNFSITKLTCKNRAHHIKILRLKLEGAARTQAPTATNYDVGSPTWGDLRVAPFLSAMEVTNLGHGPY